MTVDSALVFSDPAHQQDAPGTHVMIIGVGKYAFGKDRLESLEAGDLNQLTSPPESARAIADWFNDDFQNCAKPLASVSLLISEASSQQYTPSKPAGAQSITPPKATLANVQDAARAWADRLNSHKENMAVFYFCGHGASLGQKAALLLEDFGDPHRAFEGAIDVDTLRGTMKNSPAVQQVFLLDCCRTNADDLYQHESSLGSRIVSVSSLARGHTDPPQQFVLFPTLDGEQAFGIKNTKSVFTSAIIDAVSIAAADPSTGVWQTTTSSLMNHVDRLVSIRVPAELTHRSKPNALDASSFPFNEIDEPEKARSFVTISDLNYWGNVELKCVSANGGHPTQKKHSRHTAHDMCCAFELDEGKWAFSANVNTPPPRIRKVERNIRLPVAYVKLEVVS